MSTRMGILCWLVTIILGSPLITIVLILTVDNSFFHITNIGEYFETTCLIGIGALICSIPSIVIMLIVNASVNQTSSTQSDYLRTVLGAQLACGIISSIWAISSDALEMGLIIIGYLIVGLCIWYGGIKISIKKQKS